MVSEILSLLRTKLGGACPCGPHGNFRSVSLNVSYHWGSGWFLRYFGLKELSGSAPESGMSYFKFSCKTITIHSVVSEKSWEIVQ